MQNKCARSLDYKIPTLIKNCTFPNNIQLGRERTSFILFSKRSVNLNSINYKRDPIIIFYKLHCRAKLLHE